MPYYSRKEIEEDSGKQTSNEIASYLSDQVTEIHSELSFYQRSDENGYIYIIILNFYELLHLREVQN